MKQTLLLTLALAVVFFLDILQSSAFAQRGGKGHTAGRSADDSLTPSSRPSDGGYIVAG